MNKDILLSVVIPVFNEENRIKNIQRVTLYFSKYFPNFELIVVNDGSNDRTVRLIREINDHRIRLISYTNNKGKGFAVKKGMLAAKGDYRIFMDVDLATPLEEFEKFKKYIENESSAILVGSRKIRGAKVLLSQSQTRRQMGQIFTRLSQFVTRVQVKDFTCGFKCFSAGSAKKIFKSSRINRWGFDSEILFLAKKYNFEIREVPVRWRHDFHTRVKFPQDIINSLVDLLSVRIHDFSGKYKE